MSVRGSVRGRLILVLMAGTALVWLSASIATPAKAAAISSSKDTLNAAPSSSNLPANFSPAKSTRGRSSVLDEMNFAAPNQS